MFAKLITATILAITIALASHAAFADPPDPCSACQMRGKGGCGPFCPN